MSLALSGLHAEAASPGRFLTGPNTGNALEIASQYVTDHHQELGLTAGDVEDMLVLSEYVSAQTGTTHIALQQRHAEIRVFNAIITINVAADGSVINAGSRFVPFLSERLDGAGYPTLAADEAVASAAGHLGLTVRNSLIEVANLADREQTVRFTDGGISRVEIPVHLTYQPMGKTVRLAWEVEIHEIDSDDYWSMRVDATTGAELDRFNMTVYDDYQSQVHGFQAPPAALGGIGCSGGAGSEDYCVYPIPVEAPHFTVPLPPADGRTMQTAPSDPTASPFGWHDTNGAAGAEFTTTQGNNVDARKGATRPDGGASLVFNYELDLTQEPTVATNVNSAIANLFFWNNVIHDLWYGYGFDEAAGNFQSNNYGNGGAAGDWVLANAQAPGNCNANFATPADGSNPTMNMFTCNIASPSRDGDLDNGVIAHEYWHGVSNRLTGGPANVSCLNNSEQAGEGWSDLGGLLMTIEAGDAGADPRGIGTWLVGEGPGGPGVRTQRYSTDFAINDHTYADISGMAIPHGVGEVWASIVWEVVWELIDAHGFNPNLYDSWSTGGNNLANQLIIDGLKLQPCSPGFVDARDAIIAADQALTGGANECLLWSAFARRGLGFSADQGSSSSTSDGTEAFDLPSQCLFEVTPDQVEVCTLTPQDAVFNVDVPASFFNADVTLSAVSTPSGADIGFSVNPVPPPGSSTMTVTLPTVDYSIEVTGDDGNGHVANDTVAVLVASSLPTAATLLTPADGATGVGILPTLEWAPAAGATSYFIEIDTDPTFPLPIASASTTGTSYPLTTALTGNTVYYWHVIASNGCGDVASAVFSFTTSPVFCSNTVVAIPDNNPAGASDSIVIPSGGAISDLDIGITATHTWVGDLIFTLTNDVTGTSVIVFDRPGVPGSTYGCSDNDVDVLLDDEGTSGPVEAACPVNTGLDYTPNNPLSAFDSEDLAGTWTLMAVDTVGSDTGNLTGWCLYPTYTILEPEITVDPVDLAFGDQPIADGPTAAQAVTITNDGNATLNLSDVSLTGPDAAHFTIFSDTGEASLAPTETRTVSVNFDPSSIGGKTAALTISSDDANEPTVDVDLTGTGLAPDIGVTPEHIVFLAQVTTAGPSAPRTVTITNLGTSVLTIAGISLTGPDPGEFGIVSDSGEPTLAPAASRVVSVEFDPTSVGSMTAALTILSDDGDQPTFDVVLDGKGINAGDMLFLGRFETGDLSEWTSFTP